MLSRPYSLLLVLVSIAASLPGQSTAVMAKSSNPSIPMGTGSAAIYRFEETTGLTAVDSSGNGFAGAINGAVRSPGYSGRGLTFRAGMQDNVTVPPELFYSFGNTAYFEAWIRPTAYFSPCGNSAGIGTVFRKRAHYNDWELELMPDGAMRVVLAISMGVGIGYVTAPGTVPLNQWTKVAMSYDGNTLRAYANGALVGSQTLPMTIDWLRNYIVTQIGHNTADGNGCGYGFVGDIDEVVISSVIPATPTLGSVSVTTNLAGASFDVTGPVAFSGSGTAFSRTGLPPGSYTISYKPVFGYDAPVSQTLLLSAGGTISFVGSYVKLQPAVTVTQVSPAVARQGDQLTVCVRGNHLEA